MCRSRLEKVSYVAVGRDNAFFCVSVRQGMERIVGWKVCFSEMTLQMHGNSYWSRGVVYKRTVEERFLGWWHHLVFICIYGGLDFLWYGYGLGFG